ncbi:MAG: glycosyltransferase family 2 protein [Gemmatimonadales bacterium]|nr:glycosyltransferase family 2 protein [Gemmatimonadales bacterium]
MTRTRSRNGARRSGVLPAGPPEHPPTGPGQSPPAVSIGMPLYNAERYLRETLNAILGQTFSDFELIISDNASTDATAAICQEYTAGDGRIRYVQNHRNLGAARNFNRVFELSTGKYFKWAAADDVCLPAFLERCVRVLESDADVVIAYPRTQVIDEDGTAVTMARDELRLDSTDVRARFADLLSPMRYTNYPFYGVMVRSALQRTRLMIPYRAADRCLLAELGLHGRFREIDEVLFYRRKARGSARGLEREVEYNTGHVGKRFYFQNWRICWEHHRSVGRSKLPTPVKLDLYRSLWRWAFQNRSRYRYDIARNLKILLKRGS